ncbi:hypothetical protein [Candidatus Laterigemmans baculatus]|uniref:hypothetical protein n=1 Tax=Candidatus Laterigemmans baculatus TaxID=2770505 RepID=UPI0013DD712F|nr:hypothetical protein [Candidatus Laterigemmans baculatus]
MKAPNPIPLILLIFLLVFGCRNRSDLSSRQIERLADMQADVASGSRHLVEHDASARADWAALQLKLEDARGELDRRRDQLHADQQAFVRSQAVAPVVAEAILRIGTTLVCLSPLAVFAWFVLRTRETPEDRQLSEVLIEDWLDRQPPAPKPKLLGTTIKRLPGLKLRN